MSKNIKKVYPMKFTTFNRAFTLIELLVVIAIIGILSGFIFVSMSTSINAGKDARRRADVSNISKSLLAYQASNSSSINPSSVTSCTSNCAACIISGTGVDCPVAVLDMLKNVLPNLPSDVDSTNTQYKYQSNGGADCVITATLSSAQTYTYTCGSGFAQSSGAPAFNCSTLPGGTWANTSLGFCVMTYQAMDDGTGKPISQATGSFSQMTVADAATAEAKCVSLACPGSGCHVLTSARNTLIYNSVATIALNWSSGIVDTGNVNHGWYGSTFNNNTGPISTLDACAYNTSQNNCGGNDGVPDHRRWLSFPNSEVIWDVNNLGGACFLGNPCEYYGFNDSQYFAYWLLPAKLNLVSTVQAVGGLYLPFRCAYVIP